MNSTNKPESLPGDAVLREVWRAKDTLSAEYGHDVKKLFERIKQREKISQHRLIASADEIEQATE